MTDESPSTTSSESSTPVRKGPFRPVYRVQVPDAVKNGEALQFTIKVFKVDTNGGRRYCIVLKHSQGFINA